MKFLGILLLAAALVLADDSDSGNEGATASTSETQGRTGSTGSTTTTGNDAQGNTRFFGGGGLNSLLGAGTALAGGILGAALGGNQNFGGRPGGFGGRPVNTGFGGRPVNTGFGGRPVNTGFGGRPVNTGFGGRPVNTGFGGRPVNQGFGGGFNQGGFNQGGFNQGGFNQGGFNQGGFNQGGFNQGGGCRLSCRAPNGQFVCCGNSGLGSGGFGGNKPGQCPPVRPVCPPTRNFAPPQSCFNDRACGAVDKCCFDTCLQDRVCKPPVGIGGFGR